MSIQDLNTECGCGVWILWAGWKLMHARLRRNYREAFGYAAVLENITNSAL